MNRLFYLFPVFSTRLSRYYYGLHSFKQVSKMKGLAKNAHFREGRFCPHNLQKRHLTKGGRAKSESCSCRPDHPVDHLRLRKPHSIDPIHPNPKSVRKILFRVTESDYIRDSDVNFPNRCRSTQTPKDTGISQGLPGGKNPGLLNSQSGSTWRHQDFLGILWGQKSGLHLVGQGFHEDYSRPS